MEIQAEFKFHGKIFIFNRSPLHLDRNYDDEGYAYFLEPIPETENGFFEINLVKDNMTLQEMGYTAIYYDIEQAAPDSFISTIIKFV